MKVPANDLSKQFYKYQNEYEKKALEVLRSGWYILGNEVTNFEKEYASYFHARYCVGLASGLDALCLSFKVLGIGAGDEVIVPANTYIASIMGITSNGATPVFVEPNHYYNIDVTKIEEKITLKTKAILSVNLYGQACEMDKLQDICRRHHLYLIEDCAQSHGACYDGKYTNQYADISCFSFYPSKNCGCFGDGGAVLTDREEIADNFKIYRNYGSQKRYYNKVVGVNSRLDELQAGLLRIKLSHLEELNQERNRLAERYLRDIKNPIVKKPEIHSKAKTVWHQFVIRCEKRNEFLHFLESQEIGCSIHYPIPPHLSEAYKFLGFHEGDFPITEKYADTILSLPFYNGMTQEEQQYVIEKINQFRG